MYKAVKLIHRILIFACIAITAGSLVYYLTKWGSLPDEPGIHFGSDRNFDVYASKVYGFYPHLISGITIGIAAFSGWLIGRKSTGLNITEKGEKLFKAEIMLTIDVIALLITLTFLEWTMAVSHQRALGNITLVLIGAAFIVGGIGMIAEIITVMANKDKKALKKNSDAFHRSCRTASWLLTALYLPLLAFCWERLPSDDVIDQYHGLAYFANFDAYLAKWLLLVPSAVVIIILAVLEVIGSKAKKLGNEALVRFTDRLKLINGVFFFWWDLALICEAPLGIISAGIYAALCVVCAVLYLRKRNRSDKG
ncbi:hypothetical protein [Ruminococcus albus]|uniref:DUF1648 domain-containing protein n=1 Tax=Ruminococcus albus TaxID=1264 RepID=A0A1I1HF78_RUMAL|nr:hypothetical protein [Ruminococcus albus]SFC22614.1 hypothetical protein SAMN02910406_01352 [Ruminococcus albus]